MHYGQKQWFVFIPNNSGKNTTSMVDIAARCLNKQILIHQARSNQLEEVYRTEFQVRGITHVQFTGCHFVALKCNQAYLASLNSELKEHGFFKTQAASVTREVPDPIQQLVVEYLC